jgi:hypothetical protein
MQIQPLSGTSDAVPVALPKETPKTAAPGSQNVRKEEHVARSVSPKPARPVRDASKSERGVAVIAVLVHAAPHLVQPGTFNGQRSNLATQPPRCEKTIPFFVGHPPHAAQRKSPAA